MFLDLRRPEMRALVQSIRNLASEFSESNVQEAISEIIYRKLETKWAEDRGLVQSKGEVCIMRLLGNRCRGSGLCQHRPPGNDHATLWNFRGKPVVYVFQPYGLHSDQLMDLIHFCQTRKLDVSIDTYPAWHYPGRVLFVEIAPHEGVYLEKLRHRKFAKGKS